MKKSISILYFLLIFPLFINTSQVNAQGPNISHCAQLEPTAARPACEAAALGQSPIQGESPISAETVSTPDQSDDPRNIMNSESVTQTLNDRIPELESQIGLLQEQKKAGETREQKYDLQLNEAIAAQEPLHNRIRDLEAQLVIASDAQANSKTLNDRIVELESQIGLLQEQKKAGETREQKYDLQLNEAIAAQEPLNARIADLEGQVSVATAAQEPLNARIADLEGQVSVATAAQEDINRLNIALEESRVKLQASEEMSTGLQEQLNQIQRRLEVKNRINADLLSNLKIKDQELDDSKKECAVESATLPKLQNTLADAIGCAREKFACRCLK